METEAPKGLERLVVEEEPNEEVLHVHDLPQIYTRPNYATLLSTLDLLKYTPPTLSLCSSRVVTPRSSRTVSQTASRATSPRRNVKPQVHPSGVTTYLTTIISSPLRWLSSNTEREEIWELTAKRLSERAGRVASGDMIRKFRIPLPDATASHGMDAATHSSPPSSSSSSSEREVELSLHEPSMTEDNLGLKTWGSSLVLSSRLKDLTHLLPPLHNTNPSTRPKVLELGSGTGLLGLSAFCVWGPNIDIQLTDLEGIVDNLRRNVEVNQDVLYPSSSTNVTDDAGNMSVRVLDWSVSPSFPSPSSPPTTAASSPSPSFDVLLIADPLYSSSHPRWLVNTISAHIYRDRDSRVVIAYPLRSGFEPERAEFVSLMTELGMKKVWGEVFGGLEEDWGNADQDDEEGRGGEKVEIGIWAWR